jgi:UDP-glucose 4-epimerase
MPLFSKILVLGGTGFIGQEIVDFDVLKKYRFIVPIREKKYTHPLVARSNVEYIDYANLDINDVIEKISTVIYLIDNIQALKNSDIDPLKYVNSSLLNDILPKLKPNHHLIFFSSRLVYGKKEKLPVAELDDLNPNEKYGMTKLMQENLLKSYSKALGFKYSILRPTNIYTDNKVLLSKNLINIFVRNILKNKPLQVYGSGNQVRDYVNVKKVVETLHSLLKEGHSNKIINVGSGEGISINEIIEIMQRNWQKDIIVKHENINIDESTFIANCDVVNELVNYNSNIYKDIKNLLTNDSQ